MPDRSGSDLRISRRATAQAADSHLDSRLLRDWRELDAYILLGDPGSGKSESFRVEAEAVCGIFISARDFIALGVELESEDQTIFIDGLDEMRAGASDGRAPLDAIRAKLKDLNYPRFRICCREHDWRAQTDLQALSKVARGRDIRELHIEALSQDEQRQLLDARRSEVRDVEAFLRRSRELGLDALFGNPLLLDLTIRAVASKGGWPDSRRSIYEAACRDLATEHSAAHLEVKRLAPGDVDKLLDDAGLLCGLLLLSGKASLTQQPRATGSSIPWHTLPAELALTAPHAALESKVFATSSGDSSPRHRSIAEFLAAKAIAKRLDQGLPLGRVLALMQGNDGRVVEPLRGLLGWLAVHCHRDRHELARLDPLGVVLNGDVAAFSGADKLDLLEALRDEAIQNPWFRNSQWVSHPFAPLACEDMIAAFSQVLADHSVSPSNQALVDCVLDALKHGPPMPALRLLLESWVEDAEAWFSNRIDALDAWKHCTGFDAVKARAWLDAFQTQQLHDQDARLASALLLDLYPLYVGPQQVLLYWPNSTTATGLTTLPLFWYSGLISQSRPQDFAELAEAWVRVQPKARHPYREAELSRLRTGILANALKHAGDAASDERLKQWLRIGMDKYGHSKLDRDAGSNEVLCWLAERPARMMAVLASDWRDCRPDPVSNRRHFWQCSQLLHGARKPRNWLHWVLDQATEAPNDELAKYCFNYVAVAALESLQDFDAPSLSEVESWVSSNALKWPQAAEWLKEAWHSPLEENWRRNEYQRQREYLDESRAARDRRKTTIAPHLDSLINGTAPLSLLVQLAGAYNKRFSDVHGDSPEARVQDLLVTDEETARTAIERLSDVLDRNDLPSVEEVFAIDLKGKHHVVRPVALLGARLAHERSPDVVDHWPDALLATLVAFWLCDGLDNMPDWYKRAVETRSDLVAPIFIRHALQRLRRKGPLNVTGLWALAQEPGHASLARLVLQPLLEKFPHRASESARRELNTSLLAALHLLDHDVASAIVSSKLDLQSIDRSQRLCWLVADLPYRHDAALRLASAVGGNDRKSVAVGVALHDQRCIGRSLKQAPPATLSRLVELLGPITEVDWKQGAHWVKPADERRDTVRSLVNSLASAPSLDASVELKRLIELPSLAAWRELLRHGLLSQQGVTREAYYTHPDAASAALTIANRAPANQADLLALTLYHLHDLERHLRGSDTFALRQFWKEGRGGVDTPKDENACRDLILDALRIRLAPLGISAIPERRAADDKRSDLRLEFIGSGRPLTIPVEIKKDNNLGVWNAWRTQLQGLYTIDPTADGHGVYLVLWFGRKALRSPEGEIADSRQALTHLLTQRIAVQDRVRLRVFVMDLSLKPKSKRRPKVQQ